MSSGSLEGHEIPKEERVGAIEEGESGDLSQMPNLVKMSAVMGSVRVQHFVTDMVDYGFGCTERI